MSTTCCCAVLLLLAANAGDPLAPGRAALDALDYEGAIRALAPVAGDPALDEALRAHAFMLIAEATFGTAAPDADARAIAALEQAIALEPSIDFERRADVSPRLVAIFDALERPRAPPAAPPPPPAPPSPWWWAAAACAGGALVAGGVAGGLEAYVSLVRPPPDQPASVHTSAVTAERVAAVVALGAAVLAAGAGVVALSDP